ncbi:hypothetical protein ACOTTU_13110 [Roseobacter sp. EG26]|uniref:hypothetical protein n=1 Tax=Roseobacter sp. EG26 TaxID=3412477 RepID=UPI003CE55EBB
MAANLYDKMRVLNGIVCTISDSQVEFDKIYEHVKAESPKQLKFNGNPVSRDAIGSHLSWMTALEFVVYDGDEMVEIKARARAAAKDAKSFDNSIFEGCKDYMSSKGLEYQDFVDLVREENPLEDRAMDGFSSAIKLKAPSLADQDIQILISLLVSVKKLKKTNLSIYSATDDT